MNALEESIKHWEENLAAERPEDVKLGSKNCALCAKYFGCLCFGCPVKKATRRSNCFGSPYHDAVGARYDWKNGRSTKEQWQEAARAELEFLKGLRE